MEWDDKIKMVKYLNKDEYEEAVDFVKERSNEMDRQAIDMFATGFSLKECEKLKPIKDIVLGWRNIIEELDFRAMMRLGYMIDYLEQN